MGLIDTAAQSGDQQDERVYGVTVAEVINNIDAMGLGRVQLSLPWMPSVQPWARVAVPMAGSSRGVFFQPKIGDEVLVAFNHGDIRDPYVIGSLWNSQDRPPTSVPTDSTTKHIIRTPVGNEVILDDLTQEVTITTSTQQIIKMSPDGIEVSTTGGTASIKMTTAGTISIEGTVSIELKAPSISLQGQSIDIKADAAANINGGLACSIQGQLVTIN